MENLKGVRVVAVKGYDKIIDQINKMLQTEKIMIAATSSVLAAQKKRIFQDGKASNESKIGTYSTNPISIGKKNQARNTGKTYFKGGYRQYKQMIGKGSNFVNLRNTDQMMMDLGTTVISRNEYGIGFSNQLNGEKVEWMEEKYGKEIFSTTDKEDLLFLKVVDYEINRI